MTEIKAPEGGRPVSELQERLARAIWNIRREYEDRCDMELEDMGRGHEVWAEALAAMKAMREPTEKHRQSCELGAKVRKVAAQLSVERFNGWANPLVSDLVDAADFLEGKTPINESSEAVLSADAEISLAEGGKDD